MNNSKAHELLVEEVRIATSKLPYFRCVPRVVGLFYKVRFDQHGKVTSATPVRVNQVGESDLDGILTRWDGAGIKTGLEVKTGNAVQTQEQKDYGQWLTSRGGIYGVVRSAADAVALLERERNRGKPGT